MKKNAKKMPVTALTNDDWDVLESLARDSKRGKICRRCGTEIDGKAPGAAGSATPARRPAGRSCSSR